MERKLELPVKLYELEVDTVLQMVEKRFNNDRTEGLARFYLNKVHYCDYKEKFSDNSMKNEVIPAISSLKLDGGGDSGEQFKTPIASKKVNFEKKKEIFKIHLRRSIQWLPVRELELNAGPF